MFLLSVIFFIFVFWISLIICHVPSSYYFACFIYHSFMQSTLMWSAAYILFTCFLSTIHRASSFICHISPFIIDLSWITIDQCYNWISHTLIWHLSNTASSLKTYQPTVWWNQSSWDKTPIHFKHIGTLYTQEGFKGESGINIVSLMYICNYFKWKRIKQTKVNFEPVLMILNKKFFHKIKDRKPISKKYLNQH